MGDRKHIPIDAYRNAQARGELQERLRTDWRGWSSPRELTTDEWAQHLRILAGMEPAGAGVAIVCGRNGRPAQRYRFPVGLPAGAP